MISYLERMGFFLEREEYQRVNSYQKDTANGKSTKRCSLICLMLEQNGQTGLDIFPFCITSYLYIIYCVWIFTWLELAISAPAQSMRLTLRGTKITEYSAALLYSDWQYFLRHAIKTSHTNTIQRRNNFFYFYFCFRSQIGQFTRYRFIYNWRRWEKYLVFKESFKKGKAQR